MVGFPSRGSSDGAGFQAYGWLETASACRTRKDLLYRLLIRIYREDRHVALKLLSSYASKEIEAGRLREREILRKIASAAPLHPGFQHVVHLLEELEFESSLGRHICFITNVLCHNVPGIQSEPPGQRIPLKVILRLVKHVLKGLEYLHDECNVVHSGMPCMTLGSYHVLIWPSGRLETLQYPPHGA